MSLLTLPPEVRHFIYYHIFSSCEIELSVERDYRNSNEDGNGSQAEEEAAERVTRIKYSNLSLHNNITKTCRQLREESRWLYFTSVALKCNAADFVVSIDLFTETRIPHVYLQGITNLHVVFRSLRRPWPFEAFPALRKATFEIDEAVGPLTITTTLEEIKAWVESQDLRGFVKEVKKTLRSEVVITEYDIEKRISKGHRLFVGWRDSVQIILASHPGSEPSAPICFSFDWVNLKITVAEDGVRRMLKDIAVGHS